ncbi:Mak11p TDEL_0B07580 [Torulaspora delbrueckii]|uniref:Anaphase-promoting complex subunit 4 WD40 domain-containing protein n=1 Tax=Torulaspora delbrueckii TaxID=4950 RepID=G8ZQJ3_TORDE|nr:hypothetical protein TDEL_0B07580 [Torulaspora delbrueckii]CCE90887.1 hypothetical protein TDEL_0B07580 [Torulaspora delbrueckii]
MSGNQFRIIAGSYEHNILCLSVNLSLPTPVFTPIFHFQAHTLSVKCLDISKRYLVSGSNDEHIRIYDLQKRKELGTLLAHQGSITTLRFSNSAKEKQEEGSEIKPSASKWLLSASEDNKIIIWRVRDWENFGVLKGHTARINDLDIHPSNRIAVSVSEDHSIRLWNLMTVKKAAVLKLRGYPQNAQFVRWLGDDGQFFAAALLNKVLIYKTSTAKVQSEIDLGRLSIMHMEAKRFDGKEYIVIGLSNGRVNFYDTKPLFEEDAKDFEPEFDLLGHTNRVKDFKFYTNEYGTYLVTIGSDGKVIVWDLKTKEQLAVYDAGERLNCLALCDEATEKYETIKKRESESAEIDNQSEVESDIEGLKEAMFGKAQKKSKKNKRRKKNKKVSVQVD